MRGPTIPASSDTRRRRAMLAFAGIALACVATLLVPAVRQPMLPQLGPSPAEAPRCEPKPGMSAAYRLHMDTQLQVNMAALLLDRHATGKAATSDVGLTAKL